MWPLLAVLATLGGGFGVYEWWKMKHPAAPVGPPAPPPTVNLQAGITYALNVFTVPGLTADQVWGLLTGSGTPFAPTPPTKNAGPLVPVRVKQNVTGTGYTFSPNGYDQWIAYVHTATSNTLPRLFGSGGSDVKGIIASGIELTGALSTGDAAFVAGHGRRRHGHG